MNNILDYVKPLVDTIYKREPDYDNEFINVNLITTTILSYNLMRSSSRKLDDFHASM